MAETSASSVGQFFTNSDFTSHLPTAEQSQSFRPENPDQFFDTEGTINWIRENNFKRVALQFPDTFLPYASFVSQRIEKTLNDVKTFVLADTSYRSCCVDYIAAAHARCDCLVHFGNACLSSPSMEIPSRFVLGRLPLDIDDTCNILSESLSSIETPIVVLADASYDYALDEIVPILEKKYDKKEFLMCRVVLNNSEHPKENLVLGRNVPSLLKESQDASVIFIGTSSSSFLPIWLMTFPSISTVISYNPETKQVNNESTSSVRQLRKRLFMVEKLKDANTVGLVVGTVGLEGHRDAVSRMRTLCKQAGKKVYVISVGKVNVPKLSNFTSDIDVFVLISCPFGILLDTSDFYKPVLSLFEAEVALNPNNSWAAGNGWTADFSKFLHDSIGESNEEVDVSLVTGRIRVKQVEQSEDGTSSAGQVTLYTAGDYFKQRSWKGLDDSVRVDEDTSVTEGLAGIAASYATEPSK